MFLGCRLHRALVARGSASAKSRQSAPLTSASGRTNRAETPRQTPFMSTTTGQRCAADRPRRRQRRSPRVQRAGAPTSVGGARDAAQAGRRQRGARRRFGAGDVLACLSKPEIVSSGREILDVAVPHRLQRISGRCAQDQGTADAGRPGRRHATRPADDGRETDHWRARRRSAIDLERAMSVLSDAERAAIVQCYHNDLSHEEAAQGTGLPRRHGKDARSAG